MAYIELSHKLTDLSHNLHEGVCADAHAVEEELVELWVVEKELQHLHSRYLPGKYGELPRERRVGRVEVWKGVKNQSNQRRRNNYEYKLKRGEKTWESGAYTVTLPCDSLYPALSLSVKFDLLSK